MPSLSLRRIKVANFRGVRGPVELDFSSTPPGLYFVRGENRTDRLGSNGAGKSTLFTEAILWVLTGRVSRSQRPASDVENRSSSGGTLIELEVTLDGVGHTLVRSRRPNDLILDGARVEQREIDVLLPLTDAALRKSVLLDQFGEMFLSLRPEAKSQIFTETLNLDIWLCAADTAADRANQAERQLKSLESKQEGVRRALAEVRDQYEVARKAEAEFEEDIKTKIADARVREKQAKLAAKAARTALDDARRKFSKADSSNEVRDLENARTQLRSVARTSAQAQASRLATESAVARCERQLLLYSGTVSTCPECGQRVDEAHVKQKRQKAAEELAAAKSSLEQAEKLAAAAAGSVADAERLVAQLEETLKTALAAQAENAVAAEKSIAAHREVHRLAGVILEYKERINPFTRQCDDLEVRISALRGELKELKVDADSAAERIEQLKFWVRGFREIRLEQIDTALLELEMATNRHAEALGLEGWRVAFSTERETNKGTLSHTFTVSLYSPDSSEPVSWETYSGGEAQRWQLAVTFGLAEVLLARAGVSVDFEVIDEPTTHLSPEGVEDLLSVLYDRARDLGRRVFLIDQNALDRGAFDGVVVVAKTKQRGTYIEDAGGVVQVKTRRERVSL